MIYLEKSPTGRALCSGGCYRLIPKGTNRMTVWGGSGWNSLKICEDCYRKAFLKEGLSLVTMMHPTLVPNKPSQ